ncbi:asparaginase, partial [Acinetobacter baumannii]
MHTDRVAAWLARIGCTVADLGCGSHLPTDEDSAAAVIRGGGPVTALYNNCSGKHTGFLTTARHLGEPV